MSVTEINHRTTTETTTAGNSRHTEATIKENSHHIEVETTPAEHNLHTETNAGSNRSLQAEMVDVTTRHTTADKDETITGPTSPVDKVHRNIEAITVAITIERRILSPQYRLIQ